MFDESQVKAILQRAIELDSARSGELSRDELMQVAAEVGVSREALEQALAEQAQIHPVTLANTVQPVRLSVLRLLNVSTAIGIAGGLLSSNAWHLGVRAVPLGTSVVGTLCFGALIMLSGGLALSDATKSVRRYLEENIGVWLGFSFGGVLAGSLIAKFGSVVYSPQWIIDSAFATSIIGFVVTSVVGTTLLTIRRAAAHTPAVSGGSKPGGPGSPPSFLTRAAAGIRTWLSTVQDDGRTKRSGTALTISAQPQESSSF
ncbi:MAG TPA: hypothetical protein VK912_05620 [Longimicrobiales bacterium]|nr:hypothetical protein [Longimicrobiales bacterium]